MTHAERSRLALRASHFLLPKEGMTPEECDDAAGVCAERRRFAVADGATEAFDAGTWARALVEGWIEAESAPRTTAEFAAWATGQGARLRVRWAGRELAWYAEEKARAGSFAAFVGLGFETEGGGLRWHACALGDSCLVQLRGAATETSLPLKSHADFNSYPLLVPSHEATAASALAHAVTAAGEARAGDTFLLLSDAAAAWFFLLSQDRSPLLTDFDALLAAGDDAALAELFRDERRRGRIKDDDIAAVRVAVGDSSG